MDEVINTATHRVANQFVKNTNMTSGLDPAWVTALVQIIIAVVKSCDSKSDAAAMRRVAMFAAAPVTRLFGAPKKARANIKAQIVAHLPQANADEMVRAVLETVQAAGDAELVSLVLAVDNLDHKP